MIAPRPAPPLPPDVVAARTALDARWRTFVDMRTLADIEIHRGDRVQRLAGVLLLRAPDALRFEALSPFGPPILLVGADGDGVTVWEVLANRAYVLPSSPDAARRWLGIALSPDDLVALLSGHVRPLADAREGALLPADGLGPSLMLKGEGGTQRIWLAADGAQPLQAEWTGGKHPLRVVFTAGANGPPSRLDLATLDGRLSVTVRYRDPQVDAGLDPERLRLSVPASVRIQDFR
jgi:outer membrane lipoprotein-sorting protein